MQTDPSGRKVNETDMLVIKQGHEPTLFTGYFDFWDNDKFQVSFLLRKIFTCYNLHINGFDEIFIFILLRFFAERYHVFIFHISHFSINIFLFWLVSLFSIFQHISTINDTIADKIINKGDINNSIDKSNS